MEERDPILSEAYREASQAEPAKLLDDRILAAARAAVAPKRQRRSRWFAWAIPLSTAAVLVLAVTLILDMQRQAPPHGLEGLPAETPSLTMNDSAPAAKAEAEHIASPAKREVTPGASAARPGPARAEEAAPPAIATPEANPFPAQRAARQAAALAESRNAAAAGSVAVESSPAFGAAAKAQSAAPDTSTVEADHAPTSGPEVRVREIRRLLREGRDEEAHKALLGLRRQYPDYPLPDDLKKP